MAFGGVAVGALELTLGSTSLDNQLETVNLIYASGGTNIYGT